MNRHALLVPLAAILVLHSLTFDFVSDDAYISFVFARNFAEHNQLVFNLGDPVEGYTNFLWTLLLGLFMKLGAPPEHTARVLGTGFAIVTLYLVARLSGRVRGKASPLDYLPAVFLVASSGYAAWSSGGLETQMFTCFVTLGILFVVEERWPLAGLAFALGALTRPEGVLVFALVALHRFAANLVAERRLLPRRAELLGVAAFAALFAPYFAWRWWYYGYPFPNTFYVKTGAPPSPTYARAILSNGAFYVWQWATQSGALYAAPLAVVAAVRHRRFGSLGWLLAAGYLGYVVRVGGDFMGLHRFVMPIQVIVAVLVSLGLRALVELVPSRGGRWSRWPWRVGAPALVLVAVLALHGFGQARLSKASLLPRADRGIDRPGYLALYAHDREFLGKALAPRIRPDDFSIVGGAGVQPYFARMRAIDVFGLVSERIAHEVRPSNPRPGHQKWAPPSLLLEYEPTFLFHCYDLHHAPSSYRLCGDSGMFLANGYEPVTIHVPGLKERGEYYTFLKRKDRAWP